MDLPVLSRPAFDEIVIGAQFVGEQELKSYVVGALRQMVIADLPKVSEQSPVPPIFESFGLISQPAFSFQQFSAPPMPRYWFESESGNDLLQLQSDKIYRNWRRRKPADSYPGFEIVFASFKKDIENLSRVFDQEKLGSISFNQCEMTYVNIVIPADDKGLPIEALTDLWTGWYGDDFAYEDAYLNFRRIISRNDEPIGRVHVQFAPILSLDGKPGIKFEITSRGRPAGTDAPAVFDFLREQHDIIRQAYESVVKASVRSAWND